MDIMFDPRTEHTKELNFGTKPGKEAQNYEKYRNLNGGGIQFMPEKNIPDDESGVCSPPLWRKSPPRIPIHSEQSYNNFRILSPPSRAQAIARGQKELMEMVQAMPESSYELSLKDLVEYHSVKKLEETCLVENQDESLMEKKSLSKKGSVKRQESVKKIEKKAKKMVRSGSNINENSKGLFLKMVFPTSLGRKKKKANSYAKVSPKPEASSDSKGLKVVHKEWWKRRSSVFDESESGGMSSINGSSGSSGSSRSNCSNSRRKKSGCLCGFLPCSSKKNKSAK